MRRWNARQCPHGRLTNQPLAGHTNRASLMPHFLCLSPTHKEKREGDRYKRRKSQTLLLPHSRAHHSQQLGIAEEIFRRCSEGGNALKFDPLATKRACELDAHLGLAARNTQDGTALPPPFSPDPGEITSEPLTSRLSLASHVASVFVLCDLRKRRMD